MTERATVLDQLRSSPTRRLACLLIGCLGVAVVVLTLVRQPWAIGGDSTGQKDLLTSVAWLGFYCGCAVSMGTMFSVAMIILFCLSQARRVNKDSFAHGPR